MSRRKRARSSSYRLNWVKLKITWVLAIDLGLRHIGRNAHVVFCHRYVDQTVARAGFWLGCAVGGWLDGGRQCLAHRLTARLWLSGMCIQGSCGSPLIMSIISCETMNYRWTDVLSVDIGGSDCLSACRG